MSRKVVSASLLPPAVNAGICWVHAMLIAFDAIDIDETNIDDEDNGFVRVGDISFALTMVNIVCIWYLAN